MDVIYQNALKKNKQFVMLLEMSLDQIGDVYDCETEWVMQLWSLNTTLMQIFNLSYQIPVG